MTSLDNSLDELRVYFNTVLNLDKSTYTSSNDEPTPINCIEEMISKLPEELWTRKDLKILDPCCGNGNFGIPVYFKLLQNFTRKDILDNILYFNDINEKRLDNVKKIFNSKNITNIDFLKNKIETKYDLIMANPPYAKLLEDGSRASKNHNLIKDFIDASLKLLKPDGYILFITPDNWMSYADRNTLIEIITKLQIIYLDIHNAKKYFKKIGSSFTWYIIQNKPAYKDIIVSGTWMNKQYNGLVKSMPRKYIPLYYNQTVQNILLKTVDNEKLQKFRVLTSSDLHRFTKKHLISDKETDIYKYKLIHTPSTTVYSSKKHKYQDGYKVFISTTDKYKVFVDSCGMTQSIAFITCNDLEEANRFMKILQHPLYIFINNICRWGNFNNIRILQKFPIPDDDDIYKSFEITEEEQILINN